MSDAITFELDWSKINPRMMQARPPKELGAQKFASKRQMIIHVVYFVLAMYAPCALVYWLMMDDAPFSIVLFAYAIGVLIGMFVFSFLVMRFWYARRAAVDQTFPIREPMQVVIDQSGVSLSNAHTQTHTNWTGISAVVETPLGLQLWLGVTQYIPVPFDMIDTYDTAARINLWWGKT